MRPPAEWMELLRALGRAITEVFAAELEALSGDFSRSGRGAGVALGLLSGAAFVAFWALGVFTFVVGAVLALWMPIWAAALTLAVALTGVVGLLAWLGLRKLRSLELPARTVRRRWDDHRRWWNERVLGDEHAALDAAVESLGESNEPIE